MYDLRVCVCVCVCACVCMYVCMYVCVRVCLLTVGLEGAAPESLVTPGPAFRNAVHRVNYLIVTLVVVQQVALVVLVSAWAVVGCMCVCVYVCLRVCVCVCVRIFDQAVRCDH